MKTIFIVVVAMLTISVLGFLFIVKISLELTQSDGEGCKGECKNLKETWYVSKRMEIAAAHKLDLPYESKCRSIHGHNYIVTIYCKSHKLTDYGMIVDFAKVKEHIHGYLDHSYINDKFPNINPTAENMAKEISIMVTSICETGYCYRVEVQESEGNIAIYEVDEDENI